MPTKTRDSKVTSGVVLIAMAVLGAPMVGKAEAQNAAVRHPNLLLNQEEIEQVKLKVREHAWAARLFDRVKSKAEKDGAALEAALA